MKNHIKLMLTLITAFLALAVNAQSKDINTLLEDYNQNNLFNGNVLVVQKKKVLFQKSYGQADFGNNIPNDDKMIFRIGSLSKQFTAILIMQLKQEGKLKLESPAVSYLPWLSKTISDRITVHHLLCHSSGLTNYTADAAITNDINNNNYTPQEIALKHFKGDMQFEPGTKYAYCNTGYYLLGLIVEEIEKKPYEKVLKAKVLDVAGMGNTGMDKPEMIIPHMALGYGYDFGGYYSAVFINPYLATYSAGGLYSTTNDLRKLHEALFGGKLLKKENLDLMLKPNLGKAGYGFFIAKNPGETIIGHSGSISGYSSCILRYDEDDMTIIVMDNTRSDKRGNLENIVAGIRNILTGKKPAKPVKPAIVELNHFAPTMTGSQLVQSYKDMKGNKAEYYIHSEYALLNSMGIYLLQLGKIDDAVTVLKYGLDEYEQIDLWNNYGKALLASGNKHEAIKAFQHALELEPGNTVAKSQLEMIGSK